MSRDTFNKLHEMLKPLWVKKGGRPAISLKKCLLITLWKLCNVNSFREISDRFSISQGTSYSIFVKTTKLIAELRSKVILFPTTADTQRQVMDDFERSRSHPMPFTLGCIDGMHIKIQQPTKDSISFYNRKGFYSVILQGVVDSKLRFIDVFVGYPGRCHDAAVWNASPLHKAIEDGTINIPIDCHIIGDAAYPLETYLMVPYKDNGHLSEVQGRYNYSLSSTRVFVEQAFGVLKKKFRILNFLEIQNITLPRVIIMACIVLHNIIINIEGCNFEDHEIIEHPTNINIGSFVSTERNNSKEEARNKRNSLANLISS